MQNSWTRGYRLVLPSSLFPALCCCFQVRYNWFAAAAMVGEPSLFALQALSWSTTFACWMPRRAATPNQTCQVEEKVVST